MFLADLVFLDDSKFYEVNDGNKGSPYQLLTSAQLYEDDARIGHQDFDLKLTSRVKMSMVGVPEMAFSFWAA